VVVQQRGARQGRADQARLPARQGRGDGWKIIDVNVGGIWLVQNYRSQFAQELSKGGIDGLIAAGRAQQGRPGKS
jgi:phospholipid transport system substrate-binding protein